MLRMARDDGPGQESDVSNELDLAALLSSRLCHDLVGPVGAIGNGLEVMQDDDDPAMRDQAIELLGLSVGQALGRLKFYRMAFGASSGAGADISLRDARQVAQDFLEGSRVTLDWPDASVNVDGGIGKSAVKLLMNMVLLGSEALPRGGSLAVAINRNGAGSHLAVTASGEGARLPDKAVVALRPDVSLGEVEPKAAPVYLAVQLARTLGSELRAAQSDDRVALEAEPRQV